MGIIAEDKGKREEVMLPSWRAAKEGVKHSKTRETKGSDATFRASCEKWREAVEDKGNERK